MMNTSVSPYVILLYDACGVFAVQGTICRRSFVATLNTWTLSRSLIDRWRTTSARSRKGKQPRTSVCRILQFKRRRKIYFLNCNQHFAKYKPLQFPSPVWENCFRIFYLKDVFIFEHWTWPSQGTSTVPVVSAHFPSLLSRIALHRYYRWKLCLWYRFYRLYPFFTHDGWGEQ